jgi:hypothetical protein
MVKAIPSKNNVIKAYFWRLKLIEILKPSYSYAFEIFEVIRYWRYATGSASSEENVWKSVCPWLAL